MTKKKPPTLVDVNSLGARSVKRLAERAYPDQKSIHPSAMVKKPERLDIHQEVQTVVNAAAKSRENKRSLTFFIDKNLAKRIKAVCVEQEITMQDWLIDAALAKLGEKS